MNASIMSKEINLSASMKNAYVVQNKEESVDIAKKKASEYFASRQNPLSQSQFIGRSGSLKQQSPFRPK